MMRISTQMMNETARKAKVPINQTSMLDYVNHSAPESGDTLLDSLNQKSSKTSASSRLYSKDTYDKMEKSADCLASAAESLAREDGDSIFAKAEKSGSKEEISSVVEKLVSHLNSTMKNLKSTSGTLNDYYYQMLKEAAQTDADALHAVGIDISSNGSLSVDKEKLAASELDALKKAVGSAGNFTSKVAFIANRVADHAKTNAQYASAQYNAKGVSSYTSRNLVDFLG